jgi:putative SOS response-associated peptidase YedK
MHKPDTDAVGAVLPAAQQDKRTVVPIEREQWDTWLHGTAEEAARLVRVPPVEIYTHGAVDPAQAVALPL